MSRLEDDKLEVRQLEAVNLADRMLDSDYMLVVAYHVEGRPDTTY